MISFRNPLFCILLSFSSIVISAEEGRYPLIAVEDGDTITVQIGNETKRLQLAGIDAPEDVTNPKYSKDLARTGLSSEALLSLGKASTEQLKHLIKPGDILRIVGRLSQTDKYGRIPVFAYSEGEYSLNERLVADGYAVSMKRTTLPENTQKQLHSLQQQAQEQQNGLWGSHPESSLLWSGQSLSR